MDANTKAIPLELLPTGFIEAFVHFGADMDQLLENTGINPAMFDAKGIKISYKQQMRLIKNGIRLCATPGLGLKAGMYMDWSYNGTVGSVVTCAPSLQEGGNALRRYLAIAQPHYAMYVYEPNVYVDEDGMMVNPLTPYRAYPMDRELEIFQQEYRLAITLRLIDACGNKSVPDTRVLVTLDYPEPSYGHLFRELPCTSVTFNAEQAAIISNWQFVVEPWRELRRSNFEHLVEQCEKELAEARIETTIAARVKWHVSLYFNEQVTLEQVAEMMNLTPRALTRKLANENTTFRSIVQDVRMKLTVMHLRSSHLSVDEVAELMGFSSASSLRRAVKNWCGETVGELRGSDSDRFQGNPPPRNGFGNGGSRDERSRNDSSRNNSSRNNYGSCKTG